MAPPGTLRVRGRLRAPPPITLQEEQDQEGRDQSEVSTDPLAPSDASTDSVVVLESQSSSTELLISDDEEPQSELSVMQGLVYGSDVEGSPDNSFSDPPSPPYVPPSSTYASSSGVPEVIDLASEDEAMEPGGDYSGGK